MTRRSGSLDESSILFRSRSPSPSLSIEVGVSVGGTIYDNGNDAEGFAKLDRSFVMQMLEKPEEAKIVAAIVGLGHSLGLQITAEGIETKEVLDKLIEMGCKTGQGFLFGSPEPTAEPASSLHEAAARKRQIA